LKHKRNTLVWTPDQDSRREDSVLEQKPVSVAPAPPAPVKPKVKIAAPFRAASGPPDTRIKTLPAPPAVQKPKEEPSFEAPVITEKERLRLIDRAERVARGKEFRKQRTLDNQAKIRELALEHGISYDHAHLVHFGQWKLSRAFKIQAKLAKLKALESADIPTPPSASDG